EAETIRRMPKASAVIRQSGNKAMTSDVYRLYAVSNAGSLLGLLCYPFLVEPFLSLDVQWYGFAGCLAVYACLLAMLARRIALLPYCQIALLKESQQSVWRSDRSLDGDPPSLPGDTARSESVALPGPDNKAITQSGNKAMLLWLLLPATSTFLLNAVTAHLSTDVTPIPLLWVALLAAFLVSYIIGFSKLGEKGVWVWCVVAMIPLVFCAYATGLKGGRGFLFNLIPGILLVLLGSTFLHSWLYRIRPEARLLTRFYLCLAAGGAIGGLLSGIVAPLVFTSVIEYPIVLVTVAFLSASYAWMKTRKRYRWAGNAMQVVALVAICYVGERQFNENAGRTVLMRARNFYGCLTVCSKEIYSEFDDLDIVHRLQHGQTLHGEQFQDDELRNEPTTYYGAVGGGLAVLSHLSYTNNKPMSVGLIGLGAGTMACWGRTNDTYRFFEINPKVVNVAWNTNYFTYLSDSKAAISVALGDARRVMTTETNRYDVLVIDAYSGDAIPFHLATKEAFRLYLDRLNPGGILAVHISNWHIDLSPLCKAVAKEWGLELTGVVSEEDDLCFSASWVFIGDRPLPVQKSKLVREIDWAKVRDIALPTDACGSLINLIHYKKHQPEKE
ncbi:MAG: fused MFS/spermidine synthase, partial [bacterium]